MKRGDNLWQKESKNLMMLMLSVSLVAGAVLAGGYVGKEIETPAQIIEDVTPQEAFTLILENQDNPDFVIIDVQRREEFAKEHIENAINIDFRSETFQDELNNLDSNKTYLIYYSCPTCAAIDTKTLNIMAELNFREVYNISGGLKQWKAEGLTITE